jgi:hypothetical protein
VLNKILFCKNIADVIRNKNELDAKIKKMTYAGLEPAISRFVV